MVCTPCRAPRMLSLRSLSCCWLTRISRCMPRMPSCTMTRPAKIGSTAISDRRGDSLNISEPVSATAMTTLQICRLPKPMRALRKVMSLVARETRSPAPKRL